MARADNPIFNFCILISVIEFIEIHCNTNGDLYLTREYIAPPFVGNFIVEFGKQSAEVTILRTIRNGIVADSFHLHRFGENQFGTDTMYVTKNPKSAILTWNDKIIDVHKAKRKSTQTSLSNIGTLLDNNYVILSNEHACVKLDLRNNMDCNQFNCNDDSKIRTEQWFLTTISDEYFI